MKRAGLVVALAGLLVIGVVGPALAQQTYPNVGNLKPFSPEANFMSLPGYLRWVVHQQSGNWLSVEEANRIVAEQTQTAGR
jgi:hypothetical protein